MTNKTYTVLVHRVHAYEISAPDAETAIEWIFQGSGEEVDDWVDSTEAREVEEDE